MQRPPLCVIFPRCLDVTKKIYRPTVLTLLGVAATIAVIAGTTGFILGRAPLLGQFIPVRFDDVTGAPDRWVAFSYSLILLPVWIQPTPPSVLFCDPRERRNPPRYGS